MAQADAVAVLDISDSHWSPDANAEVSLLPTGLAMEAGEVPGKGLRRSCFLCTFFCREALSRYCLT